MFVKQLYIDDTRGGGSDVRDPSWDAIEKAICELDGKYRTQIVLQHIESEFMVVGGGGGNYSCGIMDQRGEFVVIDESREKASQVLVPCGQPTTIWSQEVIDLKAVLLAAREYSESGQRSGLVVWNGPR